MREDLLLHLGGSMAPTLRHGDLLEIEPAPPGSLAAGDVVALRPPGEEQTVVHRIVSLSPSGSFTRGDSAGCTDPWALEACELLGRVTFRHRRGRRTAVPGGRRGRVAGLARRGSRALECSFSPLLRPLYRGLAAVSPARFLIPRSLRPRVVLFRQGSEKAAKLLVGTRVAGEFDRERGEWVLRRPWRLVVGKVPPAPFEEEQR